MLLNGKLAFCHFSMLFNGNLRIEKLRGGDVRTDGRTDGRTDQPTDGPTEKWLIHLQRGKKRLLCFRITANNDSAQHQVLLLGRSKRSLRKARYIRSTQKTAIGGGIF